MRQALELMQPGFGDVLIPGVSNMYIAFVLGDQIQNARLRSELMLGVYEIPG